MPRSYADSAVSRTRCENVVTGPALGPLYAPRAPPHLITDSRHSIDVSIRKFDMTVCRSAWKASKA
jgi:hypothetical protein